MTQRQQGNLDSERACDSEREKPAGDEWSQASGVLISAEQDVVVGKKDSRLSDWLAESSSGKLGKWWMEHDNDALPLTKNEEHVQLTGLFLVKRKSSAL